MRLSSMVHIDPHARRMAVEKFSLPDCLHLPVAARTEVAIERYVGRITEVIAPGITNKALLVHAGWPCEIDEDLSIWQLPEASVLRREKQLWVHVDYRGYRRAYNESFPEDVIEGLVIDHVMNRRVARLKEFRFLRVVPISREANSSSGGLPEKWSVAHHASPEMRAKNKANPAQIQLADIADIVKMLNIKTGGAIQDPVNEAQSLLLPISRSCADA